MSIWKQSALALVILAAAAAAWLFYFPGARQTLARWNIDWLPADETVAADNGGRTQQGWSPGNAFVVTAPVVQATINDRLSAIGSGRADRSVLVKPFSSGRLTEYLVDPGSPVEQGDVIARLDSEGEQIAFDKATIALKDAEERLKRATALRSSNTVTDVQVTDARLAVENARLELRQAELDLSRRSIPAPIAGTVGILPITAGNYVTSETEIATIEDRSSLIVDFWVPERLAGAISVGSEITAVSVARPGQVFSGFVSAVDNRIDEASRTLHVQARIPNQGDRLRAGMSFQVTMRFPGDSFPSVDPLAVQWGTDGAFVWAIRDGRAERVAVRIIQRNTDSVLVDAPLLAGDVVVTEGIHVVREGAPVNIASRNREQVEPADPEAGESPASGS